MTSLTIVARNPYVLDFVMSCTAASHCPVFIVFEGLDIIVHHDRNQNFAVTLISVSHVWGTVRSEVD